MAGVLRLAIVDPSDGSRENLRNTFLSVEEVWLEAECSRFEFFADVLQQSMPDVAVVALDSDADRAFQLIQQITQQFPDVDIIAASSRTDGQFILQSIRNGANEFLALPAQLEDLLGALDRLRAARAGKGGTAHVASKIYAFIGSRGGVGCTSLAVNFGCILARNPENSVALVDLDFAMGDADVCLDIIPDHTMADIALSIDRMDLQLLKRSLSKHSSGLYLLPHPVQLDDIALIQPEHISRVLSLLKMTYTHVIIDCSKSFQQADFAALFAADEILLVTQLDVSSLRNVVRIMLALQEREGLQQKVRVIANKVGATEGEISVQRAEETIGRPVAAKVPSDARTMMAAWNSGVPLTDGAPKSKLLAAIQALTEQIVGGSAEQIKPKEKKGFFFFGSSD